MLNTTNNTQKIKYLTLEIFKGEQIPVSYIVLSIV
nr:MAG TPA: hypothetical protein [Caudoviricetes sp.]